MSTTKKKTFDCVAFKRRAQEQLRHEWAERKDEFASYGEFLEAKANASEWQRRFWEQLRKGSRNH